MRVTAKPSLHLPNKSPLGEVRIRHEILNSDLTLASASKSSHRGEQTKKLNNLLKIAQWNLRSLSHLSKIQTINSIDCDILALQEINHLNENAVEKIHTKSVMMKKERNHERGGGTMTLSELNITHWDERNINKDCSLVRLVIDGVFVIWFGNIYLNRGLPKQINKLFSAILSNIP